MKIDYRLFPDLFLIAIAVSCFVENSLILIMTLSGALLTHCPRRYGTPRIAIVTYYLMRDYPNCAPSPDGGLVAQEGGVV